MVGSSIHARNSSLLAAVLESHVTLPDNEPQADVIIIDGSALVNVLPPRTSKTFEDYATLDVLPTIRAYSIKYERTYIVFDVYRSSSLKTEARSKRGHGTRRRVTRICNGPSNWRNFFTDILVVTISVMPTLQTIGLQQLWIAFGQGRNMRWIHAHELYRSI